MTLQEGNFLKNTTKHLRKHGGKYLTGAALATFAAGVGSRSLGNHILKDSKPDTDLARTGSKLKSIGTTAMIGGGATVLRSGIYSLIKDQVKDLKKKSKRKSNY